MWIHRGLGQVWYSPWGVRPDVHLGVVSPVPVDSVSRYREGKGWLNEPILTDLWGLLRRFAAQALQGYVGHEIMSTIQVPTR